MYIETHIPVLKYKNLCTVEYTFKKLKKIQKMFGNSLR